MQTLRGKVGFDSNESGAIRCLYVGINYSVWSIILLPNVTFVFGIYWIYAKLRSSVESMICWQWTVGVEWLECMIQRFLNFCSDVNWMFLSIASVSGRIRVCKICWNFYVLHFGVSVTNRVGYIVYVQLWSFQMPLKATRHQIVWSSISTTS